MSQIVVDTITTTDGLHSVEVSVLGPGGGAGVTDHGALAGLSDDDHPQYLTQGRGDARYSQSGHGHAIADVTGLATALSGKQDTLQSGVNIKTLNGASILGSGDLVVAGTGGVTDHGALTGLTDDDHPQYLTQTRGDARYSQTGHGHAASSISDSSAVGRAVLTATDATAARTAIGAGDVTATGTQTLSNKTVFATALRETVSSMGASAIDLALGNAFTKTVTGTTTFSVANVPAAGNLVVFILELTNGGAYTVNYWAGVKWAGGTAPVLTSAGVDILGFYTHDGGTTWRGFLLSKDSK